MLIRLCVCVSGGGTKRQGRDCVFNHTCCMLATSTPEACPDSSRVSTNGKWLQSSWSTFEKEACFLRDGHTAIPDVRRPTAERDGAANPSTLRLLIMQKKINMCVLHMHTQNMRFLDALCLGACVCGTNINMLLVPYELACPCWRCMPVRTVQTWKRTLNTSAYIYITDYSYRARACSAWSKVLRENPSAVPKSSAARFRMRIISFPISTIMRGGQRWIFFFFLVFLNRG